MQPLQGGSAALRGRRKQGLSPRKPPAQARQRAQSRAQSPAATRSGSEQSSELQAEPPQRAQQPSERPAATRSGSKAAARCNNRGSFKVQKPSRNKSKTKLGLYHVSRRDFVARPASLPERERLLVLLRPGPLPTPDAGKALIHTQVLAPASLESQLCAG